MSNPFEKLKQLFKAELKNVSLFNNLKISFINKTQVTNNTFIINPKSSPPELQSKLRELIKEVYQEGTELLEESTSERIADYTAKIASNDNQTVLVFFRGRLKEDDIVLLQSCLYLRTVFHSGGDYALLKMQIVNRFHAKGANVSNLCTAGYFESHIIPMFQEFERRARVPNEVFQAIYDDIVANYPFAVFINRWMNEKQIEESIMKKMEANKKMGNMHLTIHGIGDENVVLIMKTLSEVEKRSKIVRKTINQSGGVIAVKLEFEQE